MTELFQEFGGGREVTSPFPRIPFREAMLKYGTDKPDLRAQLELVDVSDVFEGSASRPSPTSTSARWPVPDTADQPRKFFDELGDFAVEQGAKGLAWVRVGEDGALTGPIAKFLTEEDVAALLTALGRRPARDLLRRRASSTRSPRSWARSGSRPPSAPGTSRRASSASAGSWTSRCSRRTRTPGRSSSRTTPSPCRRAAWRRCSTKDPLDILAWQYDIVCNGVELSSGAIRNHEPEIMFKAFEIAGYDRGDVEREFGGMLRAFRFGAPPHGGIAPGVDRIVMLLADEPNIRETIAFPLNGNAQDLMMGARQRGRRGPPAGAAPLGAQAAPGEAPRGARRAGVREGPDRRVGRTVVLIRAAGTGAVPHPRDRECQGSGLGGMAVAPIRVLLGLLQPREECRALGDRGAGGQPAPLRRLRDALVGQGAEGGSAPERVPQLWRGLRHHRVEQHREARSASAAV